MPRKNHEEKSPKGGWLGPPSLGSKVPASHYAVGSKKGTGFTWKAYDLTTKQEKKRAKAFKKMRDKDKEGIW